MSPSGNSVGDALLQAQGWQRHSAEPRVAHHVEKLEKESLALLVVLCMLLARTIMTTTLTCFLFCPHNICAIVMSCHMWAKCSELQGFPNINPTMNGYRCRGQRPVISACVLTVAIIVDDR